MSDDPSAQEAAVDAMRVERRRHRANTATGQCVLCGWAPDPDGHRSNQFQDHVESSVLAVLTSPTKKPCAECGGNGAVRFVHPPQSVRSCPNPDCIDGFVASPAPIEGLGWVKVSDCEPITVSNDDGAGGQFVDAEGNYESYDRPATRRVIGFRLPSKVREG